MIKFNSIKDFCAFKNNCPYCSEPLSLKLWKSFSKECTSFIDGNYLCVTATALERLPPTLAIGEPIPKIDCAFKIDMSTNKITSELSNEIVFNCFSGAKFKLSRGCNNNCMMRNGNSYAYLSYPLSLDVKSMKVFTVILGTIMVTAKMKDSKSSVQYISDYVKSRTNIAIFKYQPIARCNDVSTAWASSPSDKSIASYNYPTVDYQLKKNYIYNKFIDLIDVEKLDNIDTLISRAKTYVLFE